MIKVLLYENSNFRHEIIDTILVHKVVRLCRFVSSYDSERISIVSVNLQ